MINSQCAQLFDVTTGSAKGPELAFGLRPSSLRDVKVLFTPDGLRLVVNGDRAVQVMDLVAGLPAFPSPLAHGGPVYFPTLSQDGKLLLTTCADGLTRLWDMETGKLRAEPTLQQDQYAPAALSPDGTKIIFFSTGGPAYRLTVGRGARESLAVPSNNNTRATFLRDAPHQLLRLLRQRASVIDVSSGREVAGGFFYPIAEFRVDRAVVSSDARTFVVRDVTGIWHAWQRRGAATIQHDVVLETGGVLDSFASLRPSGDYVAVPLSRGAEFGIGLLSIETGKRVQFFKGFFSQIDGTFGADGHTLLLRGALDRPLIRNRIHVRDFLSGKERFVLSEPTLGNVFESRTVSPDGKRIITTNNWGAVRFWDAADGRLIRTSLLHRDRSGVDDQSSSVSRFSPDGRLVVSTSVDGTAQIWEVATGSPMGGLLNHAGEVSAAAFCPDGKRIITATAAGDVRIWDARTGQPLTESIRQVSGTQPAPKANEIKFSPDGRYLLSFDGTSDRVWPMPPDSDGAAPPPWLLRLATACASKRLSDSGDLSFAADEVASIDGIRRQLAAMPDHAPYVEWARWFLADRATRSISPGFTITPEEAGRLASELGAPDLMPAAPSEIAAEIGAGNFIEAARLQRKNLEWARNRDGERSLVVADTRGRLARTLVELKNFDEAQSLVRASLAFYESLYSADSREIIVNRALLGTVLVNQGRYAEAEPLLVFAHDGLKHLERGRLLGNTGQWAMRDVVASLVQLYEATNRSDKAAELRANIPEDSIALPGPFP